MKPTKKYEAVEEGLADLFGFDRRDNIERDRCCPPPIGCGQKIGEFRDSLSKHEFTISGLCQACQDKVFGDDSEESMPAPVQREIEVKPTPTIVGPNDWITPPYLMYSGQAEAAKYKYHKYVGKSGNTWLVADVEDAASEVYVTNNPQNTTSRKQGFEGFGGATLKFNCVDGSVFEAHGPWHSGADGLFKDTGVDVRDKCLTFVVLAMDRVSANDGSCRFVFKDVVYKDEKPTLGKYDRYKDIEAKYPQARYCFHASKGGSSSGMTELESKRFNAARDRK